MYLKRTHSKTYSSDYIWYKRTLLRSTTRVHFISILLIICLLIFKCFSRPQEKLSKRGKVFITQSIHTKPGAPEFFNVIVNGFLTFNLEQLPSATFCRAYSEGPSLLFLSGLRRVQEIGGLKVSVKLPSLPVG